MKYAYVTLLSSNNYYPGVIGLFESLKLTNTICKEFVVIVNEDIDSKIIEKFEKLNYKVLKKEKIDFSSFIHNNSFKYWSKTFDKLHVFGLVQYDKIVFLDCDMFILKNIDELFSMPHLSGAISGKSMVNDWDGINSGLMVIKPEEGIVPKLINVIYSHDFGKDIGDQDIINYYYDWPNKDLAITEYYNIFADYVDLYINEYNYNPSKISGIHFIGQIKPWMLDGEQVNNYIDKYKKENRKYQLFYFTNYLELIDSIEDKNERRNYC